jgi:hypothetical protein
VDKKEGRRAMGDLLQRKYVKRDHRAVLNLTLLCDRRGCDQVDAAAAATDEDREIARPPDQLPADHRAALAVLHRRGRQTGQPAPATVPGEQDQGIRP